MSTLAHALVSLDRPGALDAARADLEAGRDPMDVLDEARGGMEEVGAKFDSGDYFLLELVSAASIFEEVVAELKPEIARLHGALEAKGRVVLGTVRGDIHDLGKNIVRMLLEGRGFEVVDLGVDVPQARFVDAVREHQPQVVAMSALLTASIPEMRKTVEALKEAGLREQVKVICGGGIVGEVKGNEAEADHATTDVNEGIRMIESWLCEPQ